MAVNPAYESINGFWQEVELDIGCVRVPLCDLDCQLWEKDVGKVQTWKIRVQNDVVTGYPIYSQEDWIAYKQRMASVGRPLESEIERN